MNRTYLTEDGSSWIDCFTLPESIPVNFEELWGMRPEEKSIIKLRGKEIRTPRWTQSFGRQYYFTGMNHDAIDIPQAIKVFIDYINDLDYFKTFPKINMCLANWYEDGSHYIGFHSDDERPIALRPSGESLIFSISFGETRDFVLRNKETSEDLRLKLTDRSIVVMGGLCQKTHKHSVPKVSGKKGKVLKKRINLTFRSFK